MRTIIAPLLATFIFLAFAGALPAQIKGTSMGGITTVVSDGAFDAARNPALLVTQKSPHSFGAYAKYRPYFYSDFSLGENTQSIERSDPETLTFGAITAYSYSSGSTIMGFAIGEAGGDLYNASKVEQKIFTPSGELRSTEDEVELNPSLVFSLAFPVGDSSSIGFQVGTAYNIKTTDTVEKFFFNGPPITHTQTLTKEKSATAISVGAGFGYLFSTPDSQAGILIRTGNAELYYETMDLTFEDLDDTISGMGQAGLLKYSKSVTSKKRMRYSDPASIAVGGYKRFTPLFACAFESVYTLENAYPSKALDDQESTSDTDIVEIQLKKTYTKMQSKIDVKGGVELNVMQQLAFTLGVGYSTSEMSSRTGSENSNSSRSQSKVDILYATFGAHYALDEKTCLTMTVFYADVEGSFRVQENNFSLDVKAPTRFIDTGLGVTSKF
ncbi:MAG: hypothetical protein EPN93_15910 [Spirochaetes bacterium]|nr:MAG: hypothetical protein EPN93_15910 [Spirochaetota bacterium]